MTGNGSFMDDTVNTFNLYEYSFVSMSLYWHRMRMRVHCNQDQHDIIRQFIGNKIQMETVNVQIAHKQIVIT